MKEITKEQEERLLLYATYTILYLNDTACFSVQQLNKDVNERDKESKKIYGALLKRTKAYLTKISLIVDRSIDYFVDYCTMVDEICDEAYVAFKESLLDAYKEAGIEDFEYMAKVETMRSMVELAVEAGRQVVKDASKYLSNSKWLENYLLVDMMRVANNFSDWSYRKVSQNVNIDFSNSECDVMKKFRALSALMINYSSFDNAYKKSVEMELKRKNNECKE